MRHWVLAEFDAPAALLAAVHRLREAGETRLDVYSPDEVEGVGEALGLTRSPMPAVGLFGGLVGAGGAYVTMWFANAVDYPLNVGGKPLHSWPAFIPITFEAGVLGAGLALFIGLLALMRLPRLHHPVFDHDPFVSAQVDRYWVSVTVDGGRELAETWVPVLRELGGQHVGVVEERAWS